MEFILENAPELNSSDTDSADDGKNGLNSPVQKKLNRSDTNIMREEVNLIEDKGGKGS